jgi:hypothetical protein
MVKLIQLSFQYEALKVIKMYGMIQRVVSNLAFNMNMNDLIVENFGILTEIGFNLLDMLLIENRTEFLTQHGVLFVTLVNQIAKISDEAVQGNLLRVVRYLNELLQTDPTTVQGHVGRLCSILVRGLTNVEYELSKLAFESVYIIFPVISQPDQVNLITQVVRVIYLEDFDSVHMKVVTRIVHDILKAYPDSIVQIIGSMNGMNDNGGVMSSLRSINRAKDFHEFSGMFKESLLQIRGKLRRK